MLVLSRNKDEVVVLSINGTELGRVTIADVRGDKVRVGFDFHKKIIIDRLEVFEEKQATRAIVGGVDAV